MQIFSRLLGGVGSRSDDPTDSSRTLRFRGRSRVRKLKLHESNGVMFRPHRVVALVGAMVYKVPFCGTFASQERPRL